MILRGVILFIFALLSAIMAGRSGHVVYACLFSFIAGGSAVTLILHLFLNR